MRIILSAVCVSTLACSLVQAQAWPLTTVLRSGASLPTFTADQYQLNGFSAESAATPLATVANDGTIAVMTRGRLAGQDRGAVFLLTPSGPRPWVVESQPVAGTGGIATSQSTVFAVTPSGAGNFASRIVYRNPPSPVDYTGIQIGTADSIRLIAAPGFVAPGMPVGVTYAGTSAPSSSGSGHVRFIASLEGPGVDSTNQSVLYTAGVNASPAEARPIVRRGDIAQGLPAGITFDSFSVAATTRTDGGGYFFSRLRGPGLGLHNDTSLWDDDGAGALSPIFVAEVTPVPGIAGATFGRASRYTSDPGARSLLLATTISGGNTTPADNAGIWRYTADTGITTVVRKGQLLPAPDGVNRTLEDPSNTHAIAATASGDILFASYVRTAQGDLRYAYIRKPSDDLPRILFEMDQPLAGDPLGGGLRIASMLPPTFNEAGFAVFTATLSGPGVTNATDAALLAMTPLGELSIVVREGDRITYAPGVTSRIIGFPSTLTMGSLGAMNDSGQLVFAARFFNGEDAILTTTIPTPGTALIAMAGAGMMMAVRRRRVTRS